MAKALQSAFQWYASSFEGISRHVWILSGATLINRAGTMVLAFLILYLTKSHGLSVIEAGQVLSAYGVGALFGSYGGGWLADRIGPVRVQVFSFVSSGFGFLFFTLLDGFWQFVLGSFLLGLLLELLWPAAMSAVTQFSSKASRTRAMGLMRLAANVGMVIGPAVGGFLAIYGYVYLFIVDAVTCWISALVLFIFFRSFWRQKSQEKAEVVKGERSPWQDHAYLVFIFMGFLMGMSFYQLFSTFPLTLTGSYGFNEKSIGLLLGLNAFIVVLFEMPILKWSEKKNHLSIIAIGVLLICLGFALIGFGETVGYVIFTVVVWSIGEILCIPLMNSAVAARAPASQLGRYMGLYSLSYSSSFLVAPALGTYVFEKFGPDVLWAGIGILGFFLFIGYLWLDRSGEWQAS